ncbi:HAD-IA family hydrolase [Candidatus Pacearchaeota archaeon]|nr:HAD-IA family hydrolase [Candidatus Pacearchaeota archaeon]
MIKAIIFDLGGVIYITNWDGLNRDIRNRFGFDIRPFKNEILVKDKDLINIFIDAVIGKTCIRDAVIYLGHEDTADEIIRFYKKHYTKNKILNKEMISVIKKLKKKYHIFSITDTNKEHYEADKEDNLFNLFEKVFASFELGRRKEDISVFGDVIKVIGFKPEEILFIDNHMPNIENAKEMGMVTIYYEDFPKITKFKRELKNVGIFS